MVYSRSLIFNVNLKIHPEVNNENVRNSRKNAQNISAFIQNQLVMQIIFLLDINAIIVTPEGWISLFNEKMIDYVLPSVLAASPQIRRGGSHRLQSNQPKTRCIFFPRARIELGPFNTESSALPSCLSKLPNIHLFLSFRSFHQMPYKNTKPWYVNFRPNFVMRKCHWFFSRKFDNHRYIPNWLIWTLNQLF